MSYFPTQSPDAKSPYPAPAPAPTPRPSEQTSTTTVLSESQQQQPPVPSLSAIDTLLFTIPSLEEVTSSSTTRQKRSFGQRGEESDDPTKKSKPENQDDNTDLEAKQLADEIEFSLELELFHGMETQGTDLMLPSNNDVAKVQAPQAHVREPTVLELLQTIQAASTWDAPHIINEIIPSLPIESVIQIFGQLQGIHSWKRAWILCSLNDSQRQEWNRLLFNGQPKIYGLHALQQVSLTDELIEGLKNHPMWRMNECMDPEQIVAMCSITIDSHWMLSYLAACLIENKQHAVQILDFLSPVSSQVLNHLEPVHFLELLNALADADLPNFMQRIERDYLRYVEYLFAMSSSSEKIIQMGKLLQSPAAIINAKKGIQSSLLLSEAEKKQILFKLAHARISIQDPKLLTSFHSYKPNSLPPVKLISLIQNLITFGNLWIEKDQMADFLMASKLCHLNYLSMILECAPAHVIKHFFATLSDLSMLEQLGSSLYKSGFGMIREDSPDVAVSMAIQGILSNPACQLKQKEILLSIFTKRAEYARNASKYYEAFKLALLCLDASLFSEKERISHLESQVDIPLPETATPLGVKIEPTSYFLIKSQEELAAFLKRERFEQVRSVIIQGKVRIKSKTQLEKLIAVLERCTTLAEVDFSDCKFTSDVKEISLDVPKQKAEGNEGQLKAFQQLFFLLKDWRIGKQDRRVNITWQNDSIFSGPTPLCFTVPREQDYTLSGPGLGKMVLKSFCGLPKFSQLSKLSVDEVFIYGGQLDSNSVQEIALINPHLKEFTWENAEDPKKTNIADVQEFLLELCKQVQGLEKINLNKILPKNSSFSTDFLEKLNTLTIKRKNSVTLLIDGKPLDRRTVVQDLYLDGLTPEEAIRQLDQIDPRYLKRLAYLGMESRGGEPDKKLCDKLCEVLKQAPHLERLHLSMINSGLDQFYQVFSAAPNLKCVEIDNIFLSSYTLTTPVAPLNIEEIYILYIPVELFRCIPRWCPRLKIAKITQDDLQFNDVKPFLRLSQIELIRLYDLIDLKYPPEDKRSLSYQLQAADALFQISATLHTLIISQARNPIIAQLAPLFQKKQKTLFLGNYQGELLFRKKDNLMPEVLQKLYSNRRESPEIYTDRQGRTLRAHPEIINARAPGFLQALLDQSPSIEAAAFAVEYLYLGTFTSSMSQTSYNNGVNPPISIDGGKSLTLTRQQYLEVLALLPEFLSHLISSYDRYLPDYSLYFKSFESMKNNANSAPSAEVLRFELASSESQYVHRVMLQAFCPEFAKEVAKEPSFEWKYSQETLTVFIEFLYSANLNPEKMNAKIAFELIKFSNIYPVQSLNNKCVPFLTTGTIAQHDLLNAYKDAIASKNEIVSHNCGLKILQEFDAYLPLIEQKEEGYHVELLKALNDVAVAIVNKLQQKMPPVELEMDLAHHPEMVLPPSPPKLPDSVGNAELYEVLKNPERAQKVKDVTLIVGNKEFPAHKLILIQSPYFENLFTLPMKEKDQNKITLDFDIPSEAFQLLLEYFYTGKIALPSPTLMIGLLKALEIFFPARTNRPLENGKDSNHLLAQWLKYTFARDYLDDQPAIFTLYEVLQENPLAYLEREVNDYFSTHWYELDLSSENFKKMKEEHRNLIYKIVSAGLSAVSELTKPKTIENQKSI